MKHEKRRHRCNVPSYDRTRKLYTGDSLSYHLSYPLDRQAEESRARIEHRTVSIEYKRFTIGAKEFRGRDGFVVRFTSLKLWARIPLIATCTRYNIVW